MWKPIQIQKSVNKIPKQVKLINDSEMNYHLYLNQSSCSKLQKRTKHG